MPLQPAPRAALLLLPLLLSGCVDEPSAKLDGAIVKGITANAVITATDADGNVLATGLSDAQGGYSLTLPGGYSGGVQLSASVSSAPGVETVSRCDAWSGCGTFAAASAADVDGDLVVDFGEWFPTPADFNLRAVAVAEAGTLQAVNLSPLSTLAADWAVSGDFPQGLDARSAAGANERAAQLFGLSADDLRLPAGDITDPLWVNLASTSQLKAALSHAVIAEISARYMLNPQSVIGLLSNSFVENEGRILQADTGPSANVAMLLGIMRELAQSIDMPEAKRTLILADIDAQAAGLVVGELTGYREVTVDEVLLKLGPMGEQLQELRTLAGLNDFESFLDDQEPYFSWLWSEDNLKIVPLGAEVVLYSLVASVMLDGLSAASGPVTILSDNCGFTMVLDPAAKTLRWHGPRFGQVTDITVGLTGLQAGLLTNEFDFSIVGSLSNPAASGAIDGTLSVDFGDTDFQPLLDAISSGNAASFQQALHDLAYSLEMTAALNGEAQLVRAGNLDPAQVLGGDVSLVGSIDLGALPGETIATLVVSTLNVELPNGARLYGLDNTPVVTVNVADDATVLIDGAAEGFGIPTAFGHAEGRLTNARSLFEHVRGILAGALAGNSTDLPDLVTSLFEFDFSQLSASGEALVTIPALGHEYRAELDDLTVTVFQPFSTDVAMTATADPQNLAIHYMLGDEPWEQRLLLEPQLRTTLIGPDGQFAELTAQDVLDFLSPVLDVVLDTELYQGIGEVDPSDCTDGGGGGGGGNDAPAIGLVHNGNPTNQVLAGTASMHVNFTGVLPKPVTSYFSRWYVNGVHAPLLDGLMESDIDISMLGVGNHTIRLELTDTTSATPAVIRVAQMLTVRPQPVTLAPDTSILEGVSISIRQNGVEIRRAPEGAENVEVSLVGFNPPPGSSYILRWYLNGVHYPEFDNQIYASALVNPLTRGSHSIRLEVTNAAAPTQSTVRMEEMVVVTPGNAGAGAFVPGLLATLLLLALRRRNARH